MAAQPSSTRPSGPNIALAGHSRVWRPRGRLGDPDGIALEVALAAAEGEQQAGLAGQRLHGLSAGVLDGVPAAGGARSGDPLCRGSLHRRLIAKPLKRNPCGP